MLITDDASLAGLYDDIFVIDCPKFAAKIRTGDKITINYGTIELTVQGFKTKESYIQEQKWFNEEEEKSGGASGGNHTQGSPDTSARKKRNLRHLSSHDEVTAVGLAK